MKVLHRNENHYFVVDSEFSERLTEMKRDDPSFEMDEEELKEWIMDYLDELLECKNNYEQYITIYGKLKNLSGVAVIVFHGDTQDGQWVIIDDDQQQINLQKFINQFDGKYAAIVCCVCNPGCHELVTKKSLLFIADGIVGMAYEHHFSMIHPSRGEIDAYTHNYELQHLQKQLKKKEKV